MTILDQFVRDGDRLFRWRSYFPLVLLPAFAAGICLEPPVFRTVAAERAWESCAVLVALAGLAIRIRAVGTAPAGTSERSTTAPRASQLRTSGLYSMVRHPLYLANGLMGLGIALFPGIWYLPIMATFGTLLYYERIAAREEQFLDQEFGAVFREWASRVPAIIPSVAARVPSATPMSWRKVLRGEFHGLLVITATVCGLDAVEVWCRTGRPGADPLWAWSCGLSIVALLVARFFKKSTTLLDPRP